MEIWICINIKLIYTGFYHDSVKQKKMENWQEGDLNSFFFSFSNITNASRAAYPSLNIPKHKKPHI